MANRWKCNFLLVFTFLGRMSKMQPARRFSLPEIANSKQGASTILFKFLTSVMQVTRSSRCRPPRRLNWFWESEWDVGGVPVAVCSARKNQRIPPSANAESGIPFAGLHSAYASAFNTVEIQTTCPEKLGYCVVHMLDIAELQVELSTLRIRVIVFLSTWM